jgi:hypothetical protein
VMVRPLNNVFTFRNAYTCLQCAAYQARGGSNFPRQMTLAFRMQKPTAKESGECVVRGIPGTYKQVRKCTHSVIILVCSSKFDF